MKAIRLSANAHVEVAPIGAGAFKRGLTLQAWLCAERPAAGQAILEVRDESGARRLLLSVGDDAGEVVLSTHEGSKRRQIAAPGVLQRGRWMFVSATLGPDGAAVLYLDGTPIAEGALQAAPAGACRARVGGGFEGRITAVRLWNRPLTALQVTVNRRENLERSKSDGLLCGLRMELADGRVVDTSEYGRHGTIAGPVAFVEDDAPDRHVAALPGAAHFDGERGSIQLPALAADLQKGVTLQAWIRPDAFHEGAGIFDLGSGETTDNVLLYQRGATGDLILEARDGKKVKGGVVAPGALRLERWTQITAVIAADGTSSIFVDGALAKREKIRAPAAARDGLRGRCYVGRMSWDRPFFCGAMAELRVWSRALSDREVERSWCTRLRGDEPGLVVYYRLDHFEAQGPVDLSPQRLHGKASEGVLHHTGFALPLYPIALDEGGPISTSSRLIGEQVPESAFPADRLLADAPRPAKPNPTATRASNVAAYGRASAGFVACSVYEVTVEVPEGGDPEAALEVSFDDAVEVLVARDGVQRIEPWKGRERRLLARPDGGFWRLRVLADRSLDCPALRLRLPSMLPEESEVVRPAEELQSELLLVDAAQLTTAREGGAPVCPPGTDAATLDGLARTVRQLAAAVPLPSWFTDEEAEEAAEARAEEARKKKRRKKRRKGSRSFWKKAEKRFKDAGKDLGDELDRLAGDVWEKGAPVAMSLPGARQAEALVILSVDAAGKLLKRARQEAATLESGALRQYIAQAKTLVIAAIDAGGDFIEIVGEWSGGVFRAVVHGLESALSAIRTFFERVGAELRNLIELLSFFYIWEQFLKATDLIHDVVLLGLDGLERLLRSIPDPTPHLDEVIEPLRARSLAGLRLGQVAPIKAIRFPKLPELNWALDQLESAMGRLTLPISLELPKAPVPALALAELEGLIERAAKVLPEALMTPARAGELSLEPIRALTVEALEALRPVLAAMAEFARTSLPALVVQLREVLTGRLKIPVFTDLMERFVLGGRKLSALRLAAFLSAVTLTVFCGPAAAALLVLLRELVKELGREEEEERAAPAQREGEARAQAAAVQGADAEAGSGGGGGAKNTLSRKDKQLYWCVALGELGNTALALLGTLQAGRLAKDPDDEAAQEAIQTIFLLSGVVTTSIAAMELDIAKHNHGRLRYWSIRQANCMIAGGLLKTFMGVFGKWAAKQPTDSPIDFFYNVGAFASVVTSMIELGFAGVSWQELAKDDSSLEVYNRTSWCFRALQCGCEGFGELTDSGKKKLAWSSAAAAASLAASIDELWFAADKCA